MGQFFEILGGIKALDNFFSCSTAVQGTQH